MISLFFLPVYLALLVLQWRLREPFSRVHAAFFVVFCPLLHIANLWSAQESGGYSIYGLITAHLVVLSYLTVFYLVSVLVTRHVPHANIVSSLARSVSPTFIAWCLLVWFGIKAYLISKYGVSALAVLGTVAGDEKLLFLNPMDTAMSTYSSYFALGATVVYAIRVVSGSISRLHMIGLAVLLFLVAYVITGETTLGARRFMLLLVILGFSIAFGLQWSNLRKRIVRHRLYLGAILGAALVWGFSIYYQNIRDNFFGDENAQRLVSGQPLPVLTAVVDSIIPSKDATQEVEERTLLRSGPFEVIAAVSDRLLDGYRTTNGEIVSRSIQMAIPSVFLQGQKESFNPDALVANTFNITPEGSFIEIDLAMSLLAEFIADFGFVAVLVAPIIMGLTIASYVYVLGRFGSVSPAYVVVALGTVYQTIGIVEGDFVALLGSLREFAALMAVIAATQTFLHATRRVLKIATSETVQQKS